MYGRAITIHQMSDDLRISCPSWLCSDLREDPLSAITDEEVQETRQSFPVPQLQESRPGSCRLKDRPAARQLDELP